MAATPRATSAAKASANASSRALRAGVGAGGRGRCAGVVELFVYPGALVGQVVQLIDLLRLANALAQLQNRRAPHLAWRLRGADGRALALGKSALWAPYAGAGPRKLAGLPRACFVPPLHLRNIPHLRQAVAQQAPLSRQLALAQAQGALLATVDNGCWLLARAGATAGRRVAALVLAGRLRGRLSRAGGRAG